MSGNVTALRPRDEVCLDAEPVAAMFRNLGRATAEQVVSRALGEVMLTVAGLAEQMRAHDFNGVGRKLRRLQSLADHLGMVSLAHSAAEMRLCLECRDDTALAAVWARLIRVAEASLGPARADSDRSA
jgi:hypothetical protein